MLHQLKHHLLRHCHTFSDVYASFQSMAISSLIRNMKQNIAGQFESHIGFTIHGLYRIVHGIDVFYTTFNIVAPRAHDIFFHTLKGPRSSLLSMVQLRRLIYDLEQNGEHMVMMLLHGDGMPYNCFVVEVFFMYSSFSF